MQLVDGPDHLHLTWSCRLTVSALPVTVKNNLFASLVS